MAQEVDNKDQDTISCALVTGASSGMGAHLSQTLLNSDWTVIMMSRNVDKMQQIIPKDKQDHAMIIGVDLSDMNECEKACNKALKHLGDKCQSSLNLLVHAAGASKPGLTIDQCSLKDWNWQLNLHVTSLFLLTKYCTPYLAKGKGSIVNISSIATATPFMDATTYAVAKGAVDTFTKCAALELAPKKIRVNCIAPGVIQTEFGIHMGFPKENANEYVQTSAKFVPLQRYGTCDDVTQLILFLADNQKSGWMTGQVIKLDGGRSCVDIGSGYPIAAKDNTNSARL
eukprot:1152841_1